MLLRPTSLDVHREHDVRVLSKVGRLDHFVQDLGRGALIGLKDQKTVQADFLGLGVRNRIGAVLLLFSRELLEATAREISSPEVENTMSRKVTKMVIMSTKGVTLRATFTALPPLPLT